ncbi:VOC family protein [Woeseiaceae bacterium]|nr:VOC family protein [Woeseiaceae bacterium]
MKQIKYFMIFGFLLMLGACMDRQNDEIMNIMDNKEEATRDIIGNNAFLYYKNYDEATDFYERVMGFKNVFEFEGFAVIFQTTATTFITVVNDNGRGMHTSDEPKTIAIALITDQLDAWYEYALLQEMDIRNPPKPLEDSPHNGFLVTDPGGYILEFEHFAPHDENVRFMPLLNVSETIFSETELMTERPAELGFKASIYWLYHKDAKAAADFYRDVMGFEMLVEQPFSDIYSSSQTGYIGLVLDGVGIHNATHEKAVNVGFMTNDAQAWFDYLKNQSTFKLRTKELFHEEDGNGNNLIDIVIGYDPDNYFIEIDEYLDVKFNNVIREVLGMK